MVEPGASLFVPAEPPGWDGSSPAASDGVGAGERGSGQHGAGRPGSGQPGASQRGSGEPSAGEWWTPTIYARGPWSPDALHGGPTAALLVRAIDRCDPEAGRAMHVARFTLEILHPVPRVPLEVRAAVTRPGRKVQVVEASLRGPAGDVAWARAVRIRTSESSPLTSLAAEPAVASGHLVGSGSWPFAGPDELVPSGPIQDDYPGFHNVGAELRFAVGRFDELGPAAVWIRLAVPVVPDEVPSPLQRVVAAADFGNGVSAVLPWGRFLFINPDLTVACTRDPVGEWVGLQSQTTLGVSGVGQAVSVLWDERGAGPLGVSCQNLVVEEVSAATEAADRLG